MAGWTRYALGGAVFIALHYVLVRAASGRIEDRLGALVLEAAACLGIGLSLLVGSRSQGTPSLAGVAFAVGAGFAISFSSVLLFTALRKGGPVASTGTVILGGGVALSAIVAPWLFGETYTTRRLIGIALGLAAMWVLCGES
jgi:transporter family protein